MIFAGCCITADMYIMELSPDNHNVAYRFQRCPTLSFLYVWVPEDLGEIEVLILLLSFFYYSVNSALVGSRHARPHIVI